MAGSEICLGIDVHGIRIGSLAARFRVATARMSWQMVLPKFKMHATVCLSLSMCSTRWQKSLLHRSVVYNTMEGHDFLCWLHRSSSVVTALPHEKQAPATTSLCEFAQQRHFSRPVSCVDTASRLSSHSLRESCHTSKIGCWDYSHDVQWQLHFETVSCRRR